VGAEEGGEMGAGGEGGREGGRGAGREGVLEEGVVGGGEEEVEVVVGMDEPGEEGLDNGDAGQET